MILRKLVLRDFLHFFWTQKLGKIQAWFWENYLWEVFRNFFGHKNWGKFRHKFWEKFCERFSAVFLGHKNWGKSKCDCWGNFIREFLHFIRKLKLKNVKMTFCFEFSWKVLTKLPPILTLSLSVVRKTATISKAFTLDVLVVARGQDD